VGGKQPNAWGLFDMLGNVWEWCWDVYDAEVYGTYRVLRGGGWFDEHWSCRASVRRRSHPTFRIDDVGFRVARSVPSDPQRTSAPLRRPRPRRWGLSPEGQPHHTH
jgi:formylglycine-generating enzyme required for sulfatase activity